MKYGSILTVNCPHCAQKIELPESEGEDLLRCPSCQKDFVPLAPIRGASRSGAAGTPFSPNPDDRRANRIPKILSQIAFIFAVVGMLGAVGNFYVLLSGDSAAKPVPWLLFGLAAFGCGVVLSIWTRLISIDETLKRK